MHATRSPSRGAGCGLGWFAGLLAVLLLCPDGLSARVLADSPAGRPSHRTRPPLEINPDGRLRVVDEQGRPVAKFDVRVVTADRGRAPFVEGKDGEASLQFLMGFRQAEALSVVVRAAGEYATTTEPFSGAKLKQLCRGDASIVLRRGEAVRLRLRLPAGMTWPADFMPEVYFDEDKDFAQMMWQQRNRRNGETDPNALGLQSAGPGEFTLRLARESAPIDVAVYAPGLLRYFVRGPFRLGDFKDGVLDIAVDKPAGLTVHFDVGDRKPADLPFDKSSVTVYRKLPGSTFILQAGSEEGSPLLKDFPIADLAAGAYKVMLRTQPKLGEKSFDPFGVDPGAFFDSKDVTIQPGQTARVDLHYVPYDADAFRGKRQASVHINQPDGAPAAGREVTIVYFDGHYGGLPVFSGRVPKSGAIDLKDITAKRPPGFNRDPYFVRLGRTQLGSFGFKTKDAAETFTLIVPPDAGDMAPDVELVNVATGARSKLSDFRGRVVCLDFWATWCGPCQEPMGRLDELAAEQGDHLKGRVVLMPLSIDDRPEQVTRHIAQRGWVHLDHYWAGKSELNGFDSPAARAFVVNGVPTTFLIDRNGRILWRGHPLIEAGGKDLETRIEEAAGQ